MDSPHAVERLRPKAIERLWSELERVRADVLREVDGLSQHQADFKPSRYKDSYRKRVMDLIKRKAEGKEIDTTPPEPPEPSDDLLAALQASLDAGKSNGGRKKGKR